MARGGKTRRRRELAFDRLVAEAPEEVVVLAARDQEHIARGMRNAARYGFTPAEYWRLFIAQGRKCAICRRAHDVLSIDHDHETGAVRGLLCRGCNTGLGHFRDDQDSLTEAVRYLKRAETRERLSD